MIGFISCRALFQIVAYLVDVMKTMSHMGSFSRYNNDHVALFVKMICIVSLQKITELLHIQWEFSLALDIGSKQGTSDLNFPI